jgi:hypothetical protein
MIRQRALAWAAVLALVATVPIAPLPTRISASVVALAQGDSAADVGEPTDLAIVALHCAEAPAAEALTSFFTDGAAPADCAPAVGVTIAVTENGAPVAGSPFTTDVSGTLTFPVGLGSAVEVREDLKSLPAGYEPLTREANGVPYANPVRLDPAVAGAAVLFVNVPAAVATELAQGAPAAEAGEPTDLAIVALQCADAPEAETLTSFFSSGTPPSGCAPAVGVSVAVTENEKPLSGSPFTTDADGTLAVRVGLGSEVTVQEDPKSLPSGYEPITQEANGVPYANPVQLDSATAEAAVLFVNVPASVAARLNQGTPAIDAGGATNLAHAATQDRTGCDPAYPEERTCIAPGQPLAEPCAITDQRNFTVLPPDPRRLDADRDGIGCEPRLPSGGTTVQGAGISLYTSGGNLRRAAPARSGDIAVADSRVRTDHGVRSSPPEGSRNDAVLVHRDRSRAGLWFVAPDRRSTGSLAIVSNPVFIGNGLWSWPNRFGKEDWFWHSRNHDGVWFRPRPISVGNITIAGSGSGSGNVAIASNPVFISHGVWAWPDRSHDDDWRWRNRFGIGSWPWPNRISTGNLTIAGSGKGNGNIAIASNPVFIGNGLGRWSGRDHDEGWFWRDRDHDDDWSWRDRFGKGVWGWPSNISIGNVTITGSGNGKGNVAIASNPVFISSGVWHWPSHIKNRFWLWPNHTNNSHWRWPNHFGKGVWGWPRTISVGNLTIARSGDNIAIVSNPIVITSGVWFVPNDRDHDRDWLDRGDRDHGDDQLMQGGTTQADGSDIEPLAINGSVASEAPPRKIEQGGSDEQPALAVNDGLAVEPAPSHSLETPSDSAIQPPAEPVQLPSDGDVALPSEGTIELPSDGTVTSPDSAAQPPADAGAPDTGYVAPDSGSIDTGYVDPGYVAPDPAVDPAYVAPDPGVDPGYVDPEYVAPDPVYIAPEPEYVDPGYAEAEPSYVEPTYVEPTYIEPTYVEPGYVDPGYVAPDPVSEPSYSAPQPSYVDPVIDAGYVAPEPNYVAPEISYTAPEPSYVDAGNVAPNPGMDAGGSGPDPSNFAPEPSYVDPGNVSPGNADAGNIAPDGGMDVGGNVDAGTVAPDSDGGGNEQGRRNNRD